MDECHSPLRDNRLQNNPNGVKDFSRSADQRLDRFQPVSGALEHQGIGPVEMSKKGNTSAKRNYKTLRKPGRQEKEIFEFLDSLETLFFVIMIGLFPRTEVLRKYNDRRVLNLPAASVVERENSRPVIPFVGTAGILLITANATGRYCLHDRF